jgi:hypothetical protein
MTRTIYTPCMARQGPPHSSAVWMRPKHSESQTISQMNRQPNPPNEHPRFIEKTSQNHRFKTIRKHKTFPTNLQNLQTLSKRTLQTPNPVKTNLLTPKQNTPPSSYRKPNCPTVQKHTFFYYLQINRHKVTLLQQSHTYNL